MTHDRCWISSASEFTAGIANSLQVVEHELQTLPPGETSVIGRSQFATVVTQLNAAETLVADPKTVRPTCARRSCGRCQVSAREHIAFLERESAQFQCESATIIASTSWKLTHRCGWWLGCAARLRLRR